MPTHSTEKYQDFEIEWIVVSSLELDRYSDTHGVELYYVKNKQGKLVGFIEGYEWYHISKGPCTIYILSQDSQEWSELMPESERILNDTKESVYEILQNRQLLGRVKGNIHAHANA